MPEKCETGLVAEGGGEKCEYPVPTGISYEPNKSPPLRKGSFGGAFDLDQDLAASAQFESDGSLAVDFGGAGGLAFCLTSALEISDPLLGGLEVPYESSLGGGCSIILHETPPILNENVHEASTHITAADKCQGGQAARVYSVQSSPDSARDSTRDYFVAYR